jgi:hypothetical protein
MPLTYCEMLLLSTSTATNNHKRLHTCHQATHILTRIPPHICFDITSYTPSSCIVSPCSNKLRLAMPCAPHHACDVLRGAAAVRTNCHRHNNFGIPAIKQHTC